jgi:hypothetical protein
MDHRVILINVTRVGIAQSVLGIGYGLDDEGSGFYSHQGAENFHPPHWLHTPASAEVKMGEAIHSISNTSSRRGS